MAAVSGNTLAADAIRELNGKDLTDPIEASTIQFALRKLNRLLSSWSTSRLFIPAAKGVLFELSPGKQIYTMGPGADLDEPIVHDLDSWSVRTIGPTGNLEDTDRGKPIDFLAWQGVINKDRTGADPKLLYYDENYDENGRQRLFFWPVPSQVVSVTLYLWLPPVTEIADDDTYVFPPGYERMIVNNLAMELSPGYDVAAETLAQIAEIAKDSRAMVRRHNLKRRSTKVPTEFQVGVRGYRGYDIYSDRSY